MRVAIAVLFAAQAFTSRAATAQAPAPAVIETESVVKPGPGLILRARARVTKRWQRSRIWRQSLALASQLDLGLPARGEVSRGYAVEEFHRGLDIVMDMKGPVVSAAEGSVVYAGMDWTGYGHMVWIDHGDGVRTLYAHLFSPLVKVGQRVARGQLIGLSGNSGNSTGPHLHFEISRHGTKLDPMAFFLDEVSAPQTR